MWCCARSRYLTNSVSGMHEGLIFLQPLYRFSFDEELKNWKIILLSSVISIYFSIKFRPLYSQVVGHFIRINSSCWKIIISNKINVKHNNNKIFIKIVKLFLIFYFNKHYQLTKWTILHNQIHRINRQLKGKHVFNASERIKQREAK